ncbi:MAG: hypothetical protein IJS61_05820 [Firmicutes bacterium]|nr:hypothetical protein [Bacillota bacterium]
MRAFIKRFNKKFYYKNENRELSWSRWYFDIINTDVSLREIDRYFLSMVRYINTGKHNKKNYKLKYETIKSLGYRSLVNEYYKNDR